MSKDTLTDKQKLERRLTTLEVVMNEIVKPFIEEMKENHLPHINKKLNWILIIFVGCLVSLVGISGLRVPPS